MLVIDFLKWFFVPSGVVCVEESGKLTWLQAIKNLFSGGVPRRPSGPTMQEHLGWRRAGRELKRHKCAVCGVYFWSWRKKTFCYKFSCYRERNA